MIECALLDELTSLVKRHKVSANAARITIEAIFSYIGLEIPTPPTMTRWRAERRRRREEIDVMIQEINNTITANVKTNPAKKS